MPKRNRKVKSLGDVLKDVFQKERERGARLLEGQRQADAQRKKINEVMDAPKKAPAPRVQVIDTSRPASEADKKMIANLDKPKKTATKKTPSQKNRERGDRRKATRRQDKTLKRRSRLGKR